MQTCSFIKTLNLRNTLTVILIETQNKKAIKKKANKSKTESIKQTSNHCQSLSRVCLDWMAVKARMMKIVLDELLLGNAKEPGIYD